MTSNFFCSKKNSIAKHVLKTEMLFKISHVHVHLIVKESSFPYDKRAANFVHGNSGFDRRVQGLDT